MGTVWGLRVSERLQPAAGVSGGRSQEIAVSTMAASTGKSLITAPMAGHAVPALDGQDVRGYDKGR